MRDLRHRLLAGHLGRTPGEVARAIDDTGSVIAVIEALNPAQGRRLRPVQPRKETPPGRFLADTRIFDPRYRRSARARLGLTGRHIGIGAAVIAALAGLWWWFSG